MTYNAFGGTLNLAQLNPNQQKLIILEMKKWNWKWMNGEEKNKRGEK